MRTKIFILLILSLLSISLLFTENVHAQWLNGWAYRRPITISNNCQVPTEEYQVGIQIGNSFDFSKALSDGRDIRFTLSDGSTPLPFWMDGWNSELESALFWVRTPSIPVGDTVIYLYYGNPAVDPASDGLSTFDIFDGFEEYTSGSAPGAPSNPGEWTRYEGNPILVPGSSYLCPGHRGPGMITELPLHL